MFDADVSVSGASASLLKETDMRASIPIAAVLLALSSASAFSQDMSRDQLMQRPQPMQPGKNDSVPAPRTGDASQGGVPSGTSGSGTLMQQRERGMSPDASPTAPRAPQSTGTMKQ
jgi:hypothetical protein